MKDQRGHEYEKSNRNEIFVISPVGSVKLFFIFLGHELDRPGYRL